MAPSKPTKAPAKGSKKSTSFGSAGDFQKKSKKVGKASKKQSSNKKSKNYKKPYRGQGR